MRLIATFVLAAFFIVAGVNHFWHPRFYERIVPPWIPAPALMVEISGIAEVAGGIAVTFAAWRWWAGVWLILLLVAVFPANIYMAQHPERFRGLSQAMLYARLPLQFVMIAWVWWTCLSRR